MALVKLFLDLPSEHTDTGAALLIQLGAGGVEEQVGQRGARLIVYGDDVPTLAALSERAREAFAEYGLSEQDGNLWIRMEVDADSDWKTAWMQHLQPQRITPHWIVQPVDDETPAPHGVGRIRIRPTLAFGDGAHVSTRLAAQAVERFCLHLPGASVMDVGTGTGILAMVAALSGARTVLALDVDAVALAAAQENAALNGLSEAIGFEDAAYDVDSGYDLVVANLEPRTLIEEAPRLALRARMARELLLTGFLSEQAALVEQRFREHGFSERARMDEDGWCLLVLSAR